MMTSRQRRRDTINFGLFEGFLLLLNCTISCSFCTITWHLCTPLLMVFYLKVDSKTKYIKLNEPKHRTSSNDEWSCRNFAFSSLHAPIASKYHFINQLRNSKYLFPLMLNTLNLTEVHCPLIAS
jgi:hypothetical protein